MAKAIKHQPGLLWTVLTSREALVEADRGDINNSIWDALEIFFYIYKNTREALGIHVMKQNDSWTRVEQILDMDEDEFAAEFFIFFCTVS